MPLLVVEVSDHLRALPLHIRAQTAHILPHMLPLLAAGQARGERLDKSFQAVQHPFRYPGIQDRIFQEFLQSHIKSPFHRLLLSCTLNARKG